MSGAPPRTNQLEAGEHLIAVVPMVGSGTIDDPKRPMFAPARQDIATATAAGQAPTILQSHFVMADDGVSAIVEFVAPNRKALKTILSAAAAGSIKIYDPAHNSVAEVNSALQKIKKGFNLYQFHSPASAAFAAQQQTGAAQ
jgi:hypothetical protein